MSEHNLSRGSDGPARRLNSAALWLKFLARLPALALCCSLLGNAVSQQDSPVSEPACSFGVCVVNVIARNLIVAPCEGSSVLVAYSQSSPATLIQCSKASRENDNKLLVYNRRSTGAKSYVIEGGRFLRPDSLQTAKDDGISSSFGKMKLCAESQSARAEAGELLIAEKRPSNSDAGPYCYRIRRVRTRDASLELLGSDGHPQPPASAAETRRWTPIRTKLARYSGSATGF